MTFISCSHLTGLARTSSTMLNNSGEGGHPCLVLDLCCSSLSHVWLFAIPWTTAHQTSLSFTISQSLLKLMSTESMMSCNHPVLCHPLLLLPSIFPSIRVFSNELALRIRWPKYWSFSFSISPSNEYSGLISFRMDWLDLLAVQGTLKSLLQQHSSKASTPDLRGKAFSISPLSRMLNVGLSYGLYSSIPTSLSFYHVETEC